MTSEAGLEVGEGSGSATGSHGMCGETCWDDRLFKCLERVGFLTYLMKTQ